MKKNVSLLMIVFVLLSQLLMPFVSFNASASTSHKIIGYIAPEFSYYPESAAILKSNFKVEIPGTPFTAVTDSKGYFEISGIPEDTKSYTIKVSKRTFLYRMVKNVVIDSDLAIGTEADPLTMWGGDVPINGVQDDIINDLDKLEIIESFNSARGYSNYSEDRDLNKDDAVNMTDIMIMACHYKDGIPANYPDCIPIELSSGISAPAQEQTQIPTLPSAPALNQVATQTSQATSTPTSTLTITQTPISTPAPASINIPKTINTVTPTNTPASSPSDSGRVTAIAEDVPVLSIVPSPSPKAIPTPTKVQENSKMKIPSISDFKDTSGHWASKHIQYLLEKRIIAGYNNGTIRPDSYISRAEAISIVCRALNKPLPNVDIKLDYADNNEIPQWARNYILYAKKLGMIEGYPDNTFRPMNEITRAETLVMINHFFGLRGTAKYSHTYKDDEDIPSWAKEFAAIDYELAITKGYEDDTFRPNNPITRAEFFAIVCNCIKLTKGV